MGEKLSEAVLEWKAHYNVTMGTNAIGYDKMFDNPSDAEIIASTFYDGNKEETRRKIVRRNAEEFMVSLCNRLAFETGLPTTFELEDGILYLMKNGVHERHIELTAGTGDYEIDFPIDEDYIQSIAKKVSESVVSIFDTYAELYNIYLKTSDVFSKYKILYLIADASIDPNANIDLRTIRNMLSHIELGNRSLFDTADALFGAGVRTIDYNNLAHRRVVQDKLPELEEIAKSEMRLHI